MILKRKLGDFKRWLNWQQPLSSVPMNNIESVGCGFVWGNNDPQVRLEFKSNTPLLGFYMIELEAQASSEKMHSQFFWSNGKAGYTEDNSVNLSFCSGSKSKRIVYFKNFVRELRWDPSSEPGSLSDLKISLTKVTAHFARSRMLKKLNGQQLSVLLKTSKDTEKLYKRYDQWFTPSMDSNSAYDEWRFNNEIESKIQVSPSLSVKFSIVIPVYNPEPKYLRLCIDSVINQSYSNWELCIADDASDKGGEVAGILREYEETDRRIKVTYRLNNGHISQASNSALNLASGRFIALLDHDDELAPNALNDIAITIGENPSAKIVYSDEDKIDIDGNRFDPHFKPEFNRELLLCQNYISHLGVYRADVVRQVGGFRKGFEGAQDYDLLLRCLATGITDNEIKHIPKILYHWRATQGSTAVSASEKNYTSDAGLKALKEYAKNLDNVEVVKLGVLPNTYRVVRRVMGSPLVSIIIPTKDGLNILKPCITSILEKTQYSNFEIIVVNNRSVQDDTYLYFEEISKDSRIQVIDFNEPFNFSAINNFAVKEAKGKFLALVNNDIEVISPDWLNEMLSIAQHNGVGCVGAKLYFTDGSIQHAGVTLGIGGVAGHTHKYFKGDGFGYFSKLKLTQEISAVTAACLVVKSDTYKKVGGLDETGLSIAFNDVDFCLKVRALGLKNIWTPHAELYHHESVSRGAEDTPEKKARFNKEVSYMKSKWQDELLNDPYYSPNLSLDREDFSIRIQ